MVVEVGPRNGQHGTDGGREVDGVGPAIAGRRENLVVSILGTGGLPELTNAGKERFRGVETHLRWSPSALPGSSLDLGYAHHDARFVDFTFVTPDGALRDVGRSRQRSRQLRLAGRPRRVRGRSPPGQASVQSAQHVVRRPLHQWDAGISYDRDHWHLALVGRNLGDSRHVVTESEIGDSQFYVAAPRRFDAEVGFRFF